MKRVWLCLHNEKSDDCVKCEDEWNPFGLEVLCQHEEIANGWCVTCGEWAGDDGQS